MSGIHFIGNAHVDPAWMWRLGEGFESFVSTCRSALDRMDETEEFIFSASSAALYEFVEKTDNELFAKIQKRVQEGRWEIVGGWWIEPDCNLPSGESFLRQAKYAQEYFLSRFGKMCEVGFCIDSFGHNANLPQLLSQAGIKYYVFMRPGEDELHLDKPYFYWKAKTGEKVLAYRIPFHYSNFQHSVKEKVALLESSSSFYDASIPWMLFYGVGNHGGGPTKEQIAQIQELQIENKDVKFSTVLSYFKELEKLTDIPEFELDIQHHAIGCYSAHSVLKKLNRESENALLRAEKFSQLAKSHGAYQADQTTLDKAWKYVLLNQFHDTLGGVSIKEACDDAIELYHSAITTAKEEERLALYSIVNKIDTTGSVETLIVFNPHPYEYTAPIEFELWHPDASEKGIPLESVVLNDNGNEIQTQRIEASGKIGGDRVGFVALLSLPAFAWKKFAIKRNQSPKTASTAVSIAEEIIARFRKPHAIIYDDFSDTWGHSVERYDTIIGEFAIDSIQAIESGSIRSRVRITSRYGSSELIEDIIQYQGEGHVEVRTQLNWQEKRKMVKIRFEHESEKPTFVTEIPNSWIERPADGKEYPIISWASAGELSIITDSKQSFSSDEKHLSFIVARSPLYAHHVPPHESEVDGIHQDQGSQTFRYQLHFGMVTTGVLGKESEKFNQPPCAIFTSEHRGNLL